MCIVGRTAFFHHPRNQANPTALQADFRTCVCSLKKTRKITFHAERAETLHERSHFTPLWHRSRGHKHGVLRNHDDEKVATASRCESDKKKLADISLLKKRSAMFDHKRFTRGRANLDNMSSDGGCSSQNTKPHHDESACVDLFHLLRAATHHTSHATWIPCTEVYNNPKETLDICAETHNNSHETWDICAATRNN